MKEIWTEIKKVFVSDWTMTEKILILIDILLLGVLLGWLTAPFHGGFHLFSENTWDINDSEDEDEDE